MRRSEAKQVVRRLRCAGRRMRQEYQRLYSQVNVVLMQAQHAEAELAKTEESVLLVPGREEQNEKRKEYLKHAAEWVVRAKADMDWVRQGYELLERMVAHGEAYVRSSKGAQGCQQARD